MCSLLIPVFHTSLPTCHYALIFIMFTYFNDIHSTLYPFLLYLYYSKIFEQYNCSLIFKEHEMVYLLKFIVKLFKRFCKDLLLIFKHVSLCLNFVFFGIKVVLSQLNGVLLLIYSNIFEDNKEHACINLCITSQSIALFLSWIFYNK